MLGRARPKLRCRANFRRPSLTEDGPSVNVIVSRDSVPTRASMAPHRPRLLSELLKEAVGAEASANWWPKAGLRADSPARGSHGVRGDTC